MGAPARLLRGLANVSDNRSHEVFGLAHPLYVERHAKSQLSVTVRAAAVQIKVKHEVSCLPIELSLLSIRHGSGPNHSLPCRTTHRLESRMMDVRVERSLFANVTTALALSSGLVSLLVLLEIYRIEAFGRALAK